MAARGSANAPFWLSSRARSGPPPQCCHRSPSAGTDASKDVLLGHASCRHFVPSVTWPGADTGRTFHQLGLLAADRIYKLCSCSYSPPVELGSVATIRRQRPTSTHNTSPFLMCETDPKPIRVPAIVGVDIGKMQAEHTFPHFMTVLAADRRISDLVNAGILPSDLAAKSPESVVLHLAMALADTQEGKTAAIRTV